MLQRLALWASSPDVTNVWLLASFVVAVVPITVLSYWYHSNIGNSAGGRSLMNRQNRARPSKANPKLAEGLAMARDIAAGEYGDQAKAMQRKVYWVTGLWLLACTFMFGLLIYGDYLRQQGLG